MYFGLKVTEGVKEMSSKYFSYCGDSGFDEHDTEEEAIKAANEYIDYYRDSASEGWDEAVTEVKWGIIEQHTVVIDEKPAEQARDDGVAMSADCSQWSDYGLRDVSKKGG